MNLHCVLAWRSLCCNIANYPEMLSLKITTKYIEEVDFTIHKFTLEEKYVFKWKDFLVGDSVLVPT